MAYPDTPYGYGYFEAVPTRVGGQVHNLTLYDVLDYGYDLGLTDYPIWDEEKRKWLNDRIIDHFMFREIGCETVAQFVYYLNRAMREEMPPINQLFAYLETVRPENLEMTNRYHATSEGTSQANATGDGHSYASTNPRQTMVGKDPTEYYDSGTFSDSRSDTDNSSTGLNDGWSKTGMPTDFTNKWYSGVNNALILVFDALEPCFCHIWTDHINTF